MCQIIKTEGNPKNKKNLILISFKIPILQQKMDSRVEEENPNNKKHLRKSKWTIMLFSSFLLMGDYFAYDVPFAIKEDLRAKFGNLSNDEFSSNFDHLYTVYLLPNIFLPLLNGILTEKVHF